MDQIFTVVGADGFIGRRVADKLRAAGRKVQVSTRRAPIYDALDLGNVIYCAGVTSDFRTRTFDTMDAHICHLVPLLRSAKFDSLTYLSSTRVYGPLGVASSLLGIDPANADHLYNVSKIAGEALCLSMTLKNVRVVRLSNVFGPVQASRNFLDSIIDDAISKNHVELSTSLATSRDFLWVNDAVSMIVAIAEYGSRRVYDVAFGENRTTGDVMRVISAVTGCSFNVAPGAPTVTFPVVDVAPLREEFGYQPKDVLEILGDVVADAKKNMKSRFDVR